MLRVIKEVEPAKPSTKLSHSDTLPSIAAHRHMEPRKLTALVRGELDWIVMKALEKDRSRRYDSANGFAMDVQRYLADEPVQACPPSAGYRLGKFARCHKGGLAVAALVLFFLVLLGSGIGWAVRDRSARDAEAAQQQAARQAKAAGQVESVFAEVDRLEAERKWPEALAAAQRAEAAVAGGEADAATAERVRQRLKDLQFIDRLEQIRLEDRETHADYIKRDRDYAQAFRNYGVDVEELGVGALIERLKSRPALAVPVAAALDEWVSLVVCLPGRERLAAVAHGIDPEPMRDRLRGAWGRPSAERRDVLRRLADSIDVRAQHPATLDSLAHSLKQVELPDHAIQILREAQSVYPGDYLFNAELANALYKQKDIEGAIRFYTVAASLRPNSFWRHFYLARALRQHGKLDEAVPVYRKAADINPREESEGLGWAFLAQGKLDEAVAAFRKVIELNPESVDGYRSLGRALRDQNKHVEANAAFDKAIDLDRKTVELHPNVAANYWGLGLVLRQRGKLDEAIEAFRKAVAIDPRDSASNLSLASALRAQGKPDEAVAAYRHYIELAPNDVWAQNDLGVFMSEDLKDYGKAIECFRRAIELDPRFATAYRNLGAALAQQGKRDESVVAYRNAIELDPKNVAAHNGLAWWLVAWPDARLRDPDLAVRLARKAVEVEPRAGAYQNTLGVALYRASDWKAAIAALDKSMRLRNGGDSFDWFFLAMAHWQLGETDKARGFYDRAVQWMDKNQPKSEELRRFRAEAAELLGIDKKKD
jgi:tetratricopeptide (TPR) repeat protein